MMDGICIRTSSGALAATSPLCEAPGGGGCCACEHCPRRSPLRPPPPIPSPPLKTTLHALATVHSRQCDCTEDNYTARDCTHQNTCARDCTVEDTARHCTQQNTRQQLLHNCTRQQCAQVYKARHWARVQLDTVRSKHLSV